MNDADDSPAAAAASPSPLSSSPFEEPPTTETFGHYRVMRRPDGRLWELGRGNMGITYKAEDVNLRAPVALKVIKGALLPDARARARFLREARAAARLRHTHITTVYHLGEEADACFYTMEFLDGENGEQMLKRTGPLDAPTALRLAQQVCRALIAAHGQGMLHRDLKPANLMVLNEGGEMLVKVIDFGLVKSVQTAEEESAGASAASLSQGVFQGTPLYASPEQCGVDEVIDGRSDLYSLGATIWHLLAGEPPFRGSVRTVITSHLAKPPPFEELANQHPAVVALLRDLLAKDPADRPADASALRTRLNEVLREVERPNVHPLPAAPPPPPPPRAASSSAPARSSAPRELRVEAPVPSPPALPPPPPPPVGPWAVPPASASSTNPPLLPVTVGRPASRGVNPLWIIAALVVILLLVGVGGVVALRQVLKSRPAVESDWGPPPPPPDTEPTAAPTLAATPAATPRSRFVETPPANLFAQACAEGQAALDREDYEGAVAAFDRAESLQPGSGAVAEGRKKIATEATRIAQAGYEAEKTDAVEAVKKYRLAASLGNVIAQANLGVMYANGRGVAKDDAEAFRWYRKAAEAGNAGAQANLGYAYENGRGVAKDDVEAVRWYRKAAEGGNPAAQSNLGVMYQGGRGGLPKDDAEAVRWYRKSADQGNVIAQSNLGVMIQNGRGVPKDEVEAVRWYRKGAEGGNPGAQNNLAFMYENGRGGLVKSDVEAVRWYRKAAEGGDIYAQSNFGLMLQNGRGGLTKSDTEALRWFRRSAEGGNPSAQANVGFAYANGRGVLKDEAEAVRWFRRAAEGGNAASQYNLGVMYANGRGVPKDDAEALRWYRKSANAGDADAQAALKRRGLTW